MGPIVMEKTSQNKAEYKKFFEALSSALNIALPSAKVKIPISKS